MKNPFEINVEMLEEMLSFYENNSQVKVLMGMDKKEAMIILINCLINYNDQLSYTFIEDQIDEILRND
tara:strand:- start:2027 stop:2230 length:204 start_codon:yes stop_codon:yes gene_type:complete